MAQKKKLSAKEQALLDIKKDLQKNEKCFIAFTENDKFQKLVKQWYKR